MTELLGDKYQIQNIDDTIAVGIWSRFTQSIGNLHQIQDIDPSIAVDISETFAREIDFTVEVREQVGLGRSVISPIGNRSSRGGQRDCLGFPTAVIDRPAVGELTDEQTPQRSGTVGLWDRWDDLNPHPRRDTKSGHGC